MQANDTTVLNLYVVYRGRAGSSAADVERAHGQLSARLTDGLRSNDANRLTHVGHMAARKVSAVAGRTDAVLVFAGDGAAHDDLVNPHTVKARAPLFVEQRTFRDQDVIVSIQHIFCRYTAQHALCQRNDDITAFDNRAHDKALFGAAVFAGHHNILRNVHKTARQIA